MTPFSDEARKALATRWQVCPKCNGAGIVSRPPWVAGDVNTWTGYNTAPFCCNLCEGRMVIAVPDGA